MIPASLRFIMGHVAATIFGAVGGNAAMSQMLSGANAAYALSNPAILAMLLAVFTLCMTASSLFFFWAFNVVAPSRGALGRIAMCWAAVTILSAALLYLIPLPPQISLTLTFAFFAGASGMWLARMFGANA